MITLSNGKQIEFLMASGMMGFDGEGPTFFHRILYRNLKKFNLFDPDLFSIVTKTFTFLPIKGSKLVRPIKNGWWNKYGLDNSGIEGFYKIIEILSRKNNIIISLSCNGIKCIENLKNFLRVIKKNLLNIVAVEVNTSCSNIDFKKFGDPDFVQNLCFELKTYGFPLILKVGAGGSYFGNTKMTEGIVEAIDINSVPAPGEGAISGKAAQETNWKIMRALIENISTPVIAPSIWHYEDIEKVFKIGAKAISFGSCSMIHPLRSWGPILPTLWVRRYNKETEEKDKYLKSHARFKGR
ncbi:MAG: hypothetical protein AAB491_00410 [Patescibacteria group bacterium]